MRYSTPILSLSPLFRQLLRLSPRSRRSLLFVIDFFLLPLSVFLSLWLSHPDFPSTYISNSLTWLFTSVLIVGLPLYVLTGHYKGLTRYVGSSSLYQLTARNGLLCFLLALICISFGLPFPSNSSWILLWILLTVLTGAVRFALRDFLLSYRATGQKSLVRVAIYGAGEAGAQLAAALRLAGNHHIEVFLDDEPSLWNRTINDIPIRSPQLLRQLQDQVDQVLLAIPSLSRSERRRIVSELQSNCIPVLQIPSVDDLTSGRARIDTLRPVAIDDLLGRDPVPPIHSLLGPGIRDSVVCVTGAGGSIGSELCRQIIQLSPKRLILLEISEPSLYSIDQELRRDLPDSVELFPVLGSAADFVLVNRTFIEYNVQCVFHAAAYKHVPLVEANPLAGISNNVGSTRAVCQAAFASGVREVVLISTDKAVRPTNVMGASKRLAELVVQASAAEVADSSKASTRFAMVRFGNVLGSSGSVVPLFRAQIAAGGPITLTHPDVIRYFMTIPEAAQLVLQASTLAQGGDLFLLDMGDPVRIKDLAEQLVLLSGLTLRNENDPCGEIEIVCTGLRPGEKLFEELLIDAKSSSTAHPLIFRAKEYSLPPELLWPKLDLLADEIASLNVEGTLSILADLVPEWQRSM